MHSSYSNNILDSHNKNRFFLFCQKGVVVFSLLLITKGFLRKREREREKERFDVKNFVWSERKGLKSFVFSVATNSFKKIVFFLTS